MFMKKILLILSLCLMAGPLLAQTKDVDKIVRAALAYTGKSNYPDIHNKDSLFRLLPQTREQGAKIDLVYQIIDYGRTTSMSGIAYHYKVLRWAQKNNDTTAEVVVTAEIGPIMALNGDLVNGVKTCFTALKLAEKTGNKRLIGIGYQNLAICYAQKSSIELFKFYIEKALIYSKEGGEKLLVGYELSNLRDIFGVLHQTDSARYYSLKSLDWVVKHHINFVIARDLVAYGQLQDENARLKYFRLAENIELHQNAGFPNAVLAIGQYYQEHHNLDSALFYARKAYNATRNSALSTKLSTTLLLSNSFKKTAADSILKYRVEYDNIKDSLQNISQFERAQAVAFDDEQHRHDLEAQHAAYQANLRLYVFAVIITFLLLLAFIFWRNNRTSKRANAALHKQKEQVQQALHELKATQTQLVQREKMASLGELTAGIAHEIQNPLNFVNNFSDVNQEMLVELEEELNKGDIEEAKAIAADIRKNEQKIHHHGKRADFIVKGMLEHSRTGSGEKILTNLNVLCEEFLKLSYHGLRARDKSFNADMITHFDPALPPISVSQQDMGRVMLNLFNNAFYAVNQKAKTSGPGYKPTVEVSTSVADDQMVISVRDNGSGIPDAIKDKIMQPFFTTKPTGEGTGLGLSLSYDIVVKGHGGKIEVNTNEGEYTEFTITLPL